MVKIHEGPKEFICESCSKKFSRAQTLGRHIKRVHEHERCTDNICDSCGKNFSSFHSLKHHVKKVHENVKIKKILECEKCPGKSFETKTDLGRHMRQVHIVKEKNCMCNICVSAVLLILGLNHLLY